MGLGIDLRLGLAGPPVPPAAEGTLLDADFRHNRYSVAGASYTDEAAFLAAVGGSRSGITRTIGPAIVGPELLANGSLDSDAAGWVVGGGGVDAPPGWVAPGKLQLAIAGAGSSLANRFGHAVSLTVGKAYRFGGRPAQGYSAGAANLSLGTGLLFGSVSAIGPLTTPDALYLGYGAAEAATQYIGATTSGPARTEQWDDFTVREAVPVAGHKYEALSGTISGTTPAIASGNKVVFQADDNSNTVGVAGERNRVRVVWDASRHLRLVVTRANTEIANLDLGPVEVSTPFELRFSAAANAFKASLDGTMIQRDNTGLMPAIAVYRIGRSNTGDIWDGGIDRVTLSATPMADPDMIKPDAAFMVYGDSLANGDGLGVTTTWYNALRSAYSPNRAVAKAAQAGENTTQLLAHVATDTAHRNWPTIFMDRPNGGESAAEWLGNIKAAIGHLITGRWLVVPPVLNSPVGQPDSVAGAIGEIQAALRTDPFFAGHSFNAVEQAAYAAALNDDAMRTDGTHFSTAGQAEQAVRIKAWLDANGW